MKKMLRLLIDGFKNLRLDLKLTGMDMLVAPSRVGKTAVLDACKVGLLGYHPKTAGSFSRTGHRFMRPFMGKDETQVQIYFGDGHPMINRCWELKGDTVKYYGFDRSAVPSMLFDANEYFSMSGPERIQHIFKRVEIDAKQFNVNALTAMIKTVKVESPSEHSEAAIVKVVKKAQELDEARQSEGVNFQDYLKQLIDDAKEMKRLADEQARMMDGTGRGMTVMQALGIAAPARNMTVELTRLRERQQALNAELVLLQEAGRQHARWKEQVSQVRGKLSHAQNDIVNDITFLKTKMDEAQDEYSKLLANSVYGATDKAYKQKVDAQAAHDQLKRDLKTLEQTIESLKTEHHRKLKLDHCPFCKSNRKGWQSELISDFNQKLSEMEAKHSKIESLILQALSELERATVDYDDRKKFEDHLKAARADLDSAVMGLRNVERKHDGDIRAMADHDALMANEPPAPDAQKVATIESEILTVSGEIRQADETHRRYISETTRAADAAKASKRYDAFKAESEVGRLVVNLLLDLQQQMIQQAVGGLMLKVNTFSEGIMPQLEYRDDDIGYVNEQGRWVSHVAFSGVERAISYAALSVALAGDADIRVVILDEMGVTNLKFKIIARMKELVDAGVIDNFIGADVDEAAADRYRELGCNVIELA